MFTLVFTQHSEELLCNSLAEMLNMSVEENRVGVECAEIICYLWYSLSSEEWNSLV